ncbi:MAG: hypothetical protein ACLPVY_22735 [Acidimicrobiia bacterium]
MSSAAVAFVTGITTAVLVTLCDQWYNPVQDAYERRVTERVSNEPDSE